MQEENILRELMSQHECINNMRKLAEFWGVPKSTVHAYLKPKTSKSHRAVPQQRLDDLLSKLE